MDIVRHLDYFVAIANERHFGRAAQQLGMRQPPLSQGLKRLETELGVRLCDRDSRGVTLTDAGRTLLPAAHRVLDEVEQLRLLARRQEEQATVRISVRVAPGLGAGHYAAVVAACRQAVPDADIDVTEEATADQIQDLLDGRADIGVLREPIAARGLHLGPHVSVRLNCLMPGAHPAAGAGHVRLRDLAGYDLILPPREQAPAAHDELRSTCELHGFLPGSVYEVADDRLARGLVASGMYVSFTTEQPGGDDGSVVVPIDGEPLTMVMRVAWRGGLAPPSDRLPPALVSALVGRAVDRPVPAQQPIRAVSELPVDDDGRYGTR